MLERPPARRSGGWTRPGEIEVYDRLGQDGGRPEVTDLIRRQVL